MRRERWITTLKLLGCGIATSLFASPAPGVTQSLGPSPARGGPPAQCFLMTAFRSWKAPDEKTIYIRVNLEDVFRLDLASACPGLTDPDPHLITKTRGSEAICAPLDWDLRVVSGPGGFAAPCLVKAMTPLTPAEAARLPRQSKP